MSWSTPDPRAPIRLTADHRRALRRAVRLEAQLRDRGPTRFTVDVLDLSTAGFRAETSFRLQVGGIVWLTMPGLSGLEAVVAWCEGFQVGCSFRNPLHPAVFDRIVAMAGN